MAREIKALAPSGGDHGFRHREHRSKRGRKKNRYAQEKLEHYQRERKDRKKRRGLRRDFHKLLRGHRIKITA